jgi:hypothetical protein
MSALHTQKVLEGSTAPESGAGLTSTADHGPRRAWPVIAQLFSLGASIALWGLSVSTIRAGSLDDYGLLPVFPLSFFAGLTLLVVSFVIVLCSPRPSQVLLAGHVLALILFLHGTMPLIFSEPFYPWAYKHFGVVDYIDVHGRLDGSIDIYQNWPAFFTLSAWFSRVAGTRGPLEFAAWAPLFFNICNMLQLRYLFGSLSRDVRSIWIAIFVFFAGNWVAQDYFSPQAFTFTLSLGLCAILLRWLTVATDKARMARWLAYAAAFVTRLGRRRRFASDPDDEPAGNQRVGRRAARNIAVLLFAVIVASHQLTPYMLIAGLTVLTVLGVVRPRSLVLLFAAMALGYLLPRLEFVQVNYGVLTGAGDPLHNSHNATIGFNQGDPGRLFSARASRFLSVAVCGLGLVGTIRRFRAGYKNLGVVVLAATPVLIILGDSYGGEVIYRVYLFSLPWLALLSAFALRPVRLGWMSARNLVRLTIPLLLLVALFLPSYFGMAATNEVRPGEVAASYYFYRNAPPHSLLMLASPQFPIRVTSDYDQFQLTIGESDPNLLAVKRSLRHRMFGSRDVPVIAEVMQSYGNNRSAFLVVNHNAKIYSDVFDLLPRGSLDRLELALSRSGRFHVWYRNDDATIYQLVPPQAARPSRPCASPPAASCPEA